MPQPMRSTDFRSIVEPILNEEFNGIYDQRADEWQQVFTESKGIARAYHEEPVLFGFGAAPELPDGMPVTYQSGGVLYIARYLYKVFGLAFALTKVLVASCEQLAMGLENLPQFKDLDKYWIEIHRLENDGDRISRDAVASLFSNGIDPMVVIRWKDMFAVLEEAIDATETAAQILEGIVIKNS